VNHQALVPHPYSHQPDIIDKSPDSPTIDRYFLQRLSSAEVEADQMQDVHIQVVVHFHMTHRFPRLPNVISLDPTWKLLRMRYCELKYIVHDWISR
jgi:hypothetical protein